MPYADIEKRRAAQREYSMRPEVKKRKKNRMREYYQRPEVKKRKKEYMRVYAKKTNAVQRRVRRVKENPVSKRRKQLRHKVRQAVIHQYRFTSTIHKLIGCDVPTARSHLEAQFANWMNWDNYGRGDGKWCIDHKKPIASIDIFNEEEVKRIFHYTNMQPLEFCKNSEKGCRET